MNLFIYGSWDNKFCRLEISWTRFQFKLFKYVETHLLLFINDKEVDFQLNLYNRQEMRVCCHWVQWIQCIKTATRYDIIKHISRYAYQFPYIECVLHSYMHISDPPNKNHSISKVLRVVMCLQNKVRANFTFLYAFESIITPWAAVSFLSCYHLVSIPVRLHKLAHTTPFIQ